jgi:hypothetical protein
MTPAIIKKFVITYINTTNVRMQAIRSASASELPDFSPNALAQMRQSLALVDCRVGTMFTYFH